MKCGLVMPISEMTDYPKKHWEFIKKIIIDIIRQSGLDDEPELVSHDPVDINITRRIFTNLFENDLIICVVSGNNPNVFYELGLRVAFDMPCIIVKDERTRFSFDISLFEHVIYPDNAELWNKNRNIQLKLERFKSDLTYKLTSYCKAFKSSVEIESPLEGLLDDAHYARIKRNPPFKLEGTYEYQCYVVETGYCHGGICEIEPVLEQGCFVDWKLTGYRCYSRQSSAEPLVRFEHPYQWETRKAVVFPDKYFFVSYEIQAKLNIKGFIEGSVSVQRPSKRVDKFTGHYHQDEGEFVKKGKFKMIRVEPADINHYEFKLLGNK